MNILYASMSGAATYLTAKAALFYAGFQASGIAAGSYAAGMMSTAATASGGAVQAGTVVAILQSMGAAGLGIATSGALFLVGAVGLLIVL